MLLKILQILFLSQLKLLVGDKLYICEDCGETMEILHEWQEKHGFIDGMYETVLGCPYCGGSCIETVKCSICGEYLIGDFIQLNRDNSYIGECCYKKMTNEDLGGWSK